MKIASMTYRLSAFVLAASLLAACGNGDKFDNDVPADPPKAEAVAEPEPETSNDGQVTERAQKLIDMCIAEGASAEVCTCQITAVADGLDPSDFDRLVALAEAGDETEAKSMLANIMSNNPHIATQMSNDMLKCATN